MRTGSLIGLVRWLKMTERERKAIEKSVSGKP